MSLKLNVIRGTFFFLKNFHQLLVIRNAASI